METVEDLFAEAEQARRTGQYDLALQKLNAILALDPTNSTAEQKLDQITKEEMVYQEKATEEARDQRLTEVTEKWSNLPRPQAVDTVAPTSQQPITRSNEFEISQKLKSIIIPSVNFADAPLQTAVDFLNDTTRQLDSDHTGSTLSPGPRRSPRPSRSRSLSRTCRWARCCATSPSWRR